MQGGPEPLPKTAHPDNKGANRKTPGTSAGGCPHWHTELRASAMGMSGTEAPVVAKTLAAKPSTRKRARDTTPSGELK